MMTSKLVGCALLLMAMLSGCSFLSTAEDRSAEQVGKAVALYCKNTDESFRNVFDVKVNVAANPNSININCK